MDKRYQVFISSTYTDLKDERRAVYQTLREMDCIGRSKLIVSFKLAAA